jgi:hypothetical protein
MKKRAAARAQTPVIGAEGSKRLGLAAPEEEEEEPLPLLVPEPEGSIACGFDLPVMQVLTPLMMPES